MKNIFLLSQKDFKRKWKNPIVIFGFLLMPLIFTLIFGMIFGGNGDGSLLEITVLAVDNDQSLVSKLFLGALTQGEVGSIITLKKVEEPEGRKLLDKGKASALIIIPENFGQKIWDSQPVTVHLLKNPSEQFLPQIVEEITDILSLLGSSFLFLFAEEMQQIRELQGLDNIPDDSISSLSVLFKDRMEGLEKYVLPPVISLKQTTVGKEEEASLSFSIYQYILPGMSIIFLLFICNVVFEDLLKEKETGTLLRLTISPMKLTEFILSKALTSCIIGMLCTFVLIIAGWLIFSIQWGNPVHVLLHVLTLNIMMAGFIAFLYSFVRTERQAGAVTSTVILIMSLLGGSMTPVDFFPPFIQTISKFTLNYWGILSFRKVMTNAPFEEIFPLMTGMLLAGIVFSLLASTFLHKNLRKGLTQ